MWNSMRTFVSVCTIGAAMYLPSSNASGQVNGPTVSATGQATLKAKPEILRARILLNATGADTKQALDALNKRREAVTAKLVEAGAVKDSLNASEPVVGAGGPLTQQQRQMQMMMRMQQGGNKAPEEPTTVTLSTTVSLDWALSGGEGADALVVAEDLKSKIKAAIPISTAAAVEKTPEQEELEEEMASAGVSYDMSGNAAPKVDEPSFTFVHVVTDAEQESLSKQAFTRASTSAQRLATAAGRSVGPVVQLSEAGDDESNPYTAYMRTMTAQTDMPANEDVVEATGEASNEVTHVVNVKAVFELK